MNMALRRAAVLLFSAALLATAACSGPEARKARYQQRADEFFAAGNLEKARVEFGNVLQVDPKNAKAHYHLGLIAERQVKPRDAAGQYQAAIDSDPDYTAARAGLGRLYLLAGLPDRVRETIEPGLGKTPGDAQLLTVRGALRSQQGDKDGALADAEAAVKAAPGDEHALALLASLYRRESRMPEAIKALDEGIRLNPRATDLRVIQAELLQLTGDKAGAEKQLREVLRIEPANVTHWQQLARLHLLEKDVDGAERALRDAVGQMPDNIEVKFALVGFLAAQRGVEVGDRQMRDFVAKEPGKADLQLAFGRYLEGQGKTDEAKAVYRKVIDAEGVKPAGLDARSRLAAVFIAKGEVNEGQKLVDEVLAKNPRDNEALALRGSLELTRGNPAGAISDLRSVLRDKPDATAVMRVLANAHLRNNETALAEEVLREAVRLDPRDPVLRLDLATLLASSGKPELARPFLEALTAEMPGNAVVWESLVRVELALGDKAASRRTVEDFRKVQPGSPLVAMMSGAVNEQDGKPQAAMADYEAALKLRPDSVEPLMAMSRLDQAAGQGAKSVARIEAAIHDKPDNLALRLLLGHVLIGQRRPADAVKAFDDVIAKNGAAWSAYRGKALAQDAQGQADAALATLAQGRARNPASVDLAVDLASMSLRLKRPDEAIKVYEDLTKQNPASVGFAANLAMLLADRQDPQSLERANKLVEPLAGREEPEALDVRGWVKFRSGNSADALSLIQRAVDKAPNIPQFRYHLAMVQLRSHKRASARENLDAALKPGIGFPGYDEAKAAHKNLVDAG